jgi:hypothetical protein
MRQLQVNSDRSARLLNLTSAGEKATPSQRLMSRENFYFVYSTSLLIDLTLENPDVDRHHSIGCEFSP